MALDADVSLLDGRLSGVFDLAYQRVEVGCFAGPSLPGMRILLQDTVCLPLPAVVALVFGLSRLLTVGGCLS